MFLTNLSITNFRSYEHLETEIPKGILLLTGGNAQGKTSFLEAVFYCATFASSLADNDRQLIRFDALREPLAVARIIVQFTKSDSDHRLEARIIREPSGNYSRIRKEILLDGVKTTAQNAVGKFPAVLFIPQMTAILEGNPQERRRYLNITLSQSVPGYAQVLSEFKQIVTQRNALLKLLSDRRTDPQQLDYWDDLMAKKAAVLIYHRVRALGSLETYADNAHQRLTGNQEKLRLVYQPSFDPAYTSDDSRQEPFSLKDSVDRTGFSESDIAEGFLNRLKTIRKSEIERGISTVGPHRDEFRILGNEIDLGVFGSRGQIRTALISLKLAEINWMEAQTGTSPLFLLDETLVELDNQRRKDLMDWLDNCRQGILTTTDLSYFSNSFIRNHTVWHVENGKIQKMPDS